MPVNYSKFDHIEDSDDDKPDPKAVEAAALRRVIAEQVQRKTTGGPATILDTKDEAPQPTPAHQTDRFAYADGDCQKIAHELLKKCIGRALSIKVGNGVVSVLGVEKVEGDASLFLVRGKMRHTWDLNFKVAWSYQWVAANFEEGMRRAEGAIIFGEFTDATSLGSDKSPPILKKSWTDKGGLELAQQKQVEKSLGGKPWPPEQGTLLFGITKTMEVFVEELPKQTTIAMLKSKEERELNAEEDAREFKDVATNPRSTLTET